MKSLAPLWKYDQKVLLQEMYDNKINAILIRVCSYKLEKKHLGKSILELKDYLISSMDKFKISCVGEGGEFESFVLDCPIYKQKIVIKESEIIVEKDQPFNFVARLNFLKLKLENK